MAVQTKRRPDTTLIERAARRLGTHGGPTEEPFPGAGMAPTVTAEAPTAGIATPASVAGVDARPSPSDKASPTVDIDLVRLKKEGVVTPETVRSKTTEEMRLIKRRVLANYLEAEHEHANLIAVTSALAGEGKTFVALNLAMSLALEKDFRVLLVDADVAKPAISERLGIAPRFGLTDLLTDSDIDVAQVLLRTSVQSLTIIPAGNPHELNTELLSSKRMASLLDEFSRRYADRIIIFDSPPVLVTTEASALARRMGQVVFVVQAGRTRRQAVEEALELIPDCAHIGLVMNQSQNRWGSVEFGSYYGKYYKDR
ncbi:MAG: tyrosine-protein kinase family protein [Rhodospirillales bacterium]|nr:MAG: tyrosine-protein kinase family protein [Rhodospirillales bacterium]